MKDEDRIENNNDEHIVSCSMEIFARTDKLVMLQAIQFVHPNRRHGAYL